MTIQDRFYRDRWGVRELGERAYLRSREHVPSHHEIDAEREMLRVVTSPIDLAHRGWK